jgi:CBS domain-containing protein
MGMITHDSILRALSNFGVRLEELCVSNAVVKAQTYRPEDDLFDLLDRLKETNAVLIVDGEEKLIGIVTSYDSTEYFRRRAEDMMLVEDIETMIKDLVLAVFTDEIGEVDQEKLARTIAEVTSSHRALLGRYQNALLHFLELQGQERPQVDSDHVEESFSHLAPKEKPKEFDDLTLYEYTELLLHKSHWGRFGPFFDLEPSALRNLLSAVRDTRNDLAHFRGEISATQRDQLRFCADWLAQHPVEQLVEHLIGILVSWPVYKGTTDREPAVIQEADSAYETSTQAEDTVVPTEEVLGPDDSRYAPLAIWLQSRPSKDDRLQLTFEEVE